MKGTKHTTTHETQEMRKTFRFSHLRTKANESHNKKW